MPGVRWYPRWITVLVPTLVKMPLLPLLVGSCKQELQSPVSSPMTPRLWGSKVDKGTVFFSAEAQSFCGGNALTVLNLAPACTCK